MPVLESVYWKNYLQKVYAEPIFVHFISLSLKTKVSFIISNDNSQFGVFSVVVSFHELAPLQPLMGCWMLFEFDYEFMQVFVILEPFYIGKVMLPVSSLSWSWNSLYCSGIKSKLKIFVNFVRWFSVGSCLNLTMYSWRYRHFGALLYWEGDASLLPVSSLSWSWNSFYCSGIKSKIFVNFVRWFSARSCLNSLHTYS